jgi:hypothetical protein
MVHIRYTLLADGTSDAVLMEVIDWMFAEHAPHLRVAGTFARDLNTKDRGLAVRAQAAQKNYPCDMLFVHRDCEGMEHGRRIQEIDGGTRERVGLVVPVAPCRMTEAWLFSDEQAIRFAAENQSGSVKLDIPPKRQWESLADPKAVLLQILCRASEKSGRALKKFRPEAARHLIAQRTESFAGLRGLEAFDDLERRFVQLLNEL